ncbi:hypothetical protein RHMOL_Rhmol05G0179200 [Rhododendron molle]|uniref:Uncharacterized protein n=1 Tax=Rhododendron molle TaxID=49168 RepID=A0ACC0NQ74_RHOML|nr:hypothetical protein RHMOL_Rhmol05G0179200 [Rhododendron molle]
MADGTISLEEGLGFKAIDSNEIRRKQRGISDPLSPIQLNLMPSGNLNRSSPTELEAHNPKYMKPIELGNPLGLIPDGIGKKDTFKQHLVGPTQMEPLSTPPTSTNLVESNKAQVGSLVDTLSESESEDELLEVLVGVVRSSLAGCLPEAGLGLEEKADDY